MGPLIERYNEWRAQKNCTRTDGTENQLTEEVETKITWSDQCITNEIGKCLLYIVSRDLLYRVSRVKLVSRRNQLVIGQYRIYLKPTTDFLPSLRLSMYSVFTT